MSVVPYTRRPADPDPSSRQWVELMQPAIELAKAVAGTDFVPRAMRDNPAAITAAILYGDEVGLGPMQSLAKIAVIDGKPSLAAEAQRALILSVGHDLWIEESSVTRCTVAGRRRDSDSTSRVTWTMDDAKRANLAGKSNWRAYPRAMLLARASAELARAIFADAIGGLAATEELEELVEAAPTGDDQPEAPATNRRRRRQTTTAAATVSAPPPPTAAPADPPLPDEPPLASDAQRRMLHALFRERGIDDRQARLDYCSTVTGRAIPTSTNLTLDEASAVIDALEAAAPDPPPEPPADPAPEGPPDAPSAPVSDPPLPGDPEGQQTLGEPLVTAQEAQTLQTMRGEANVDDRWMREQLLAIGAEIPDGPVRATVLRTLTRAQAEQLRGALNGAIDALEED